MKTKNRLWLAIPIGLALCVGCVVVGLAMYGSRLDRSSKAFARQAFSDMSDGWSAKVVRERSSAEFLAAVDDGKLEKLLSALRKAGKVRSFDEPVGEARAMFVAGKGSGITAEYKIQALHESGQVSYRISLVRRHGEWSLLGLWAKSDP